MGDLDVFVRFAGFFYFSFDSSIVNQDNMRGLYNAICINKDGFLDIIEATSYSSTIYVQ